MRRLICRLVFLLLCAAAAVVPLLGNSAHRATATEFAGWPSHWEGEAIEQLPLGSRDEQFNRRFPGRVAKFTDGRREFIFRWITTASRQLHSSADCFRGMGYKVTPAPAVLDVEGRRWSCFIATDREHRLRVRERISDDDGGEWTDVSAWFWSILVQGRSGPWLSVTVVENASPAEHQYK